MMRTCDECRREWDAGTVAARVCPECQVARYRELLRDHVRGEFVNVFDTFEQRAKEGSES